MSTPSNSVVSYDSHGQPSYLTNASNITSYDVHGRPIYANGSSGSLLNQHEADNLTEAARATAQTSNYGGMALRPPSTPTPVAPDYTNLLALEDPNYRNQAINKAMGEYDQLEASTRAQGFQAAHNAGNVYSNRLMQQGINPVASGVVAAQAKMPIYNQLSQITTDREKTRLDATSRSDALAAQIASTVAQLQLNYSKNLADWNQQNTAYQLDLNKFNANQYQQNSQFDQTLAWQKQAAMLAGGSQSKGIGGSGSSIPHFSGMMVRAKNDGGFSSNGGEFTPQFKDYVKQLGDAGGDNVVSSAMHGRNLRELLIDGYQMPWDRVPMGTLSGGMIDHDESYLRMLGFIADPDVPTYNQQVMEYSDFVTGPRGYGYTENKT